jgi:iron complex outermembrane receptor protein
LGGRWTNDKKRGSYAQVSSPFTQALRATEALVFPNLSENRFTYRVGLNYKPTDDMLVFATHSTGYKSGGFNSGGGSPALTPPVSRRLFDRETVKNYELGIKSSWLDRAFKANLTLYRMDIAGFQDRAFDGVSFIVRNAGSLRQQGFEFDTVISPSRNLSFTGSLAYLDSEFTDYTGGANLPGLTGTQDLTGQPNTFSPEWVGNVAVDWSGDIGSSGLAWAINANLSFVSDQFVGTSLDANPQTLADGYTQIGARATINGSDDRWSLSVFARNLGNTSYRPLAVYQPLGGPLGLNNTVFPGSTAVRVQASEPRSYGIAASFKF